MEPSVFFDSVVPQPPFTSRQVGVARVFALVKARDSDAVRAILRENRTRTPFFNAQDAVRLRRDAFPCFF